MKICEAIKLYCEEVVEQHLPLFKCFDEITLEIESNGIEAEIPKIKEQIFELVIKKEFLVSNVDDMMEKLIEEFPVHECGEKLIATGVKCFTCSVTRDSVFCLDCFEEDKHKEHKYIIVKSEGENCGCGFDGIKASGYCSHHSTSLDMRNDYVMYDNLAAIFWYLSHELFRLSRNIITKGDPSKVLELVYEEISSLIIWLTGHGELEEFNRILAKVLIYWPIYTYTKLNTILELDDPIEYSFITLSDDLLNMMQSNNAYFVTSHCELLFYLSILHYLANEGINSFILLDTFLLDVLVKDEYISVNLSHSEHLRNQLIWRLSFETKYNPFYSNYILPTDYSGVNTNIKEHLFYSWHLLTSKTSNYEGFDPFIFDYSNFLELVNEIISIPALCVEEYEKQHEFLKNSILSEVLYERLNCFVSVSMLCDYSAELRNLVFTHIQILITLLAERFTQTAVLLNSLPDTNLNKIKCVFEYLNETNSNRSLQIHFKDEEKEELFANSCLTIVAYLLSIYPTAVIHITRRVKRDCFENDDNYAIELQNLLFENHFNNENTANILTKYLLIEEENLLPIMHLLLYLIIFLEINNFVGNKELDKSFPYKTGYGLHEPVMLYSEDEIESNEKEYLYEITNDYVTILTVYFEKHCEIRKMDIIGLIAYSNPILEPIEQAVSEYLNEIFDYLLSKSMFDAKMFIRLGIKSHEILESCFSSDEKRGQFKLYSHLYLCEQFIENESFKYLDLFVKEFVTKFGIYNNKTNEIEIDHLEKPEAIKLLCDALKYLILISNNEIEIEDENTLLTNEFLELFLYHQDKHLTSFQVHEEFEHKTYYSEELIDELIEKHCEINRSFNFINQIFYNSSIGKETLTLKVNSFRSLQLFHPFLADVATFPNEYADLCREFNHPLEKELDDEIANTMNKNYINFLVSNSAFQSMMKEIINLLVDYKYFDFVTENELLSVIVAIKFTIGSIQYDSSLNSELIILHASRHIGQLDTDYFLYFEHTIESILSENLFAISRKMNVTLPDRLEELKLKASFRNTCTNELLVNEKNINLSIEEQKLYNCTICSESIVEVLESGLIEPSLNLMYDECKSVANINWFECSTNSKCSENNKIIIENAREQLETHDYSFLLYEREVLKITKCGHYYHEKCYQEMETNILKTCSVCRSFTNVVFEEQESSDVITNLRNALKLATTLNHCYEYENAEFVECHKMDFTFLEIILPYIQKISSMESIVENNEDIFKEEIAYSGTMDFFLAEPLVFISNLFIKVISIIMVSSYLNLVNSILGLPESSFPAEWEKNQFRTLIEITASCTYNATFIYRLISGELNTKYRELISDESFSYLELIEKEANPLINGFYLYSHMSFHNPKEIFDCEMNKQRLNIFQLVQKTTQLSFLENFDEKIENTLDQLNVNEESDQEETMLEFRTEFLEEYMEQEELSTNELLNCLISNTIVMFPTLNRSKILYKNLSFLQLFPENVLNLFHEYSLVCEKCKVLSVICLSCQKIICPCVYGERAFIEHRGECNPEPIYFIRNANILIFMFSQHYNFISAGPYISEEGYDDPNFLKGLPLTRNNALLTLLEDHILCNETYLMDQQYGCVSGEVLLDLTVELIEMIKME